MALDEHTTIGAVGIAGSGETSRTRVNYGALREGMYQAVEQPFSPVRDPWADCDQLGASDGILTLAPAVVRKSMLAEKLRQALVSAPQAHNVEHPPEDRIWLRLVLHAGEITRDKPGRARARDHPAFRLLDSPPLREALAGFTGEYDQVTADVKEAYRFGWIRLPGGECSCYPLASPFPRCTSRLGEAGVNSRGAAHVARLYR